jgi:hypothetical protein
MRIRARQNNFRGGRKLMQLTEVHRNQAMSAS